MTREEAIQRLYRMGRSHVGIIDENTLADNKALSMAIEALEDRPTVEWIDADGNKVRLDADGHPLDSCWCSNCGEWLVASDEHEVLGKFCPNCGARMGGESDG